MIIYMSPYILKMYNKYLQLKFHEISFQIIQVREMSKRETVCVFVAGGEAVWDRVGYTDENNTSHELILVEIGWVMDFFFYFYMYFHFL